MNADYVCEHEAHVHSDEVYHVNLCAYEITEAYNSLASMGVKSTLEPQGWSPRQPECQNL